MGSSGCASKARFHSGISQVSFAQIHTPIASEQFLVNRVGRFRHNNGRVIIKPHGTYFSIPNVQRPTSDAESDSMEIMRDPNREVKLIRAESRDSVTCFCDNRIRACAVIEASLTHLHSTLTLL